MTSIHPPLTPDTEWPRADRPTMYFIGVTTHESSIMRIFPLWAEYLGLGDVMIRGINFRLRDDPAQYRRAIELIKDDPMCRGALVTAHKLDIFRAGHDLFDELDDFATLMREISSISKRDERLVGHAKDPITSGLALEAIIGPEYWEKTGAEVLVCGAGGASVALIWYLVQHKHGSNRPSRILVTDCRESRLQEMQELHVQIAVDLPVEYHLVSRSEETDRLLCQLRPRSLVVNATGLGKDAPGSPITDQAQWPVEAIAWEFNYRGELLFLEQARRQQSVSDLRIVDGWQYFIYGWSTVIAEVFDLELPSTGPEMEDLSRIATKMR